MKFFMILITCVFLSGCSLIPKVKFDTPNTVPQATEKAKTKDVCKGQATFNDAGDILTCSKGYFASTQNYEKKERRMTIVERIKSFINNLIGWGFWGLIALVILCPSAIGFIFGRVIEAVGGIANKSLKATVKAIQKTRKNGKDLNTSLDSEMDADVKKHIATLKEKENI